MKISPDMTRVTLSVEGKYPEYGETLRRSAEETEQLRNMLSEFGFEPTDLKTLSFNVNTEFESYKDKGAYKQRFVGYKFRHVLKIEFLSDNKRLSKVLHALTNSPIKPEFRLSYTVSDPETAKNELLEKAVLNAKEKASLLSKTAGVKLKDIQHIDYSWGKINFEVEPMDRMMEGEYYLDGDIEDDQCKFDIEPDDIEASDTVTVLWEIE